MKLNLRGLVAAPHTPLQPDGGLNLAAVPRQAGSLSENGVVGAFVCGTTGEGMSLTNPERQAVAEAWVRARSGLKVIVHVSHLCLADSQALAAHAQAAGADAVAILAPCFFKPASVADLVAYSADVAAAAPTLPFFYYHMPSMTGVNFKMADYLPLAAERIPTFAGIKFTNEDLMDYGRTLALAGGDYEVLFGRDEILLSALALGATGAVGSTYNFFAPLYREIVAAYLAGEMEKARRGQERAMEMVAVLGKHGGMTAGKAVMELIGIDCGPTRPPLRALDAAQREALRADLGRLGLFDVASKVRE